MKRTPLKRRTPLRAKTQLQNKTPEKVKNANVRRSQRAAQERLAEVERGGSDYEKEFKAIRPYVWARSGRRCEAIIPGVCTGRAVHVHHRKQRGRGGPNSMANLLDVCFGCHNWIHHHPLDATGRGMLVGTRDDPETVPVTPWRL